MPYISVIPTVAAINKEAATYAQNLTYRAFGALKGLTYGNNNTLALSYNNRLQLTNWTVPNVLGWEYSYNDYYNADDGRVLFAKNTASSTAAGLRDDKLDRSYDYDQVGRLNGSHTGYEARLHMNRQGAGDSTNYGAYSQAYNYDQWGNMTSRVGWGGWDGAGVNYTLAYSNNRQSINPINNAAMQYDASGNQTNNGYWSFQYDATGQMTAATDGGNVLSHNYDGDGLRFKKVANGTTTYYLRSSPLGGQVVAEFNGSGTWTRGYVYLGSQMIAIQQGTNNTVSWVHQDPVTKSQRTTASNGTVTSTIDLDPWGGETSVSANQSFQPHCFTSYERDVNNHDQAQARSYQRQSSSVGKNQCRPEARPPSCLTSVVICNKKCVFLQRRVLRLSTLAASSSINSEVFELSDGM